MKQIVKANIVARGASLEQGKQDVTLFTGVGFTCVAVYVQPQDVYTLQASTNRLLVVIDGSGELAWQDSEQPASLPLMRGDFAALTHGGSYDITNVGQAVLILALCSAGD